MATDETGIGMNDRVAGRCPHCGAELGNAVAACPGCGRPLGASVAIGQGVVAATAARVAARRQARLHDLGMAGPPPRGQLSPSPLHDVMARDLSIEVQALPFVNYALHHSGMTGVGRLTVRNGGFEASQNLMVRAVLSPESFGDAWDTNIPELAPGESRELEISLPLDAAKLRAITEKQRVFLKVTVSDRHETLASHMSPIDVLAYNEWLFVPDLLFMLAAFVQSNDAALHPVVEYAARHLKDATGSAAFAGYQAGGPKRVLAMLGALHSALHADAGLAYINPPPSFERTGQKIRLVADTLRQKRGTCLDLAVLQAALWEHVGLHPAILVIPGHAMLGCWLEPPAEAGPVVTLHEPGTARDALMDALWQGRWQAFNSTEVASGEDLDTAARHGAALLDQALSKADGYAFVIDIHACRRQVTPLP